MPSNKNGSNGAENHDLPFAKELWEACDRLRGSVESAEYKHLVLGLVFLKYISDAFERRRSFLEAATRKEGGDLYTEDEEQRAEVLEDRDEYISENVFWVPKKARWSALLAAATQPDIGQRIDAALGEIEKSNEEQLRGVLPRIYARAPLASQKLGELVTTIAKVGFGDDEDKARDILGRTYEYFIKRFAAAEGHRGGEFYTPQSVTRLLVEMLEPYEGRVLDPACGSCGLFIQSADFVKSHGGKSREISIYGQENNQATWRIGRMNLAIHGLSGDIRLGDSLLDDQHTGLKADFVLANPPFNEKQWEAQQVADDSRWKFGTPPDSNANYAWIQHFIHHLAPDGRAGFVMANGSLTARDNGEHLIREELIRADLIDCILELPNKLFFTTQIPVCLWFLDRNRNRAGGRDRRGKILFLDARQLGVLLSRNQRELSEEDIVRITSTYRAWRGEHETVYEDIPGFCREATIDEVEARGKFLAPGAFTAERHVVEEELSPAAKIDRLADVTADRTERFMAAIRDDIADNLYRAWFVDLDPVTSDDPMARVGLQDGVFSLFGEKLIDTEAGLAPADWEIVDIYALAEVIYGAPYSSKLFNEDGVGMPLLRIREIGMDDPAVFTAEEHSKGVVIARGDIVCGMDGEFRVQRWRGPDSVLNQRVCHFRPLEGVPSTYLNAAVKRPISFFERSKTGTTVIHLLKRDINQMRFARPPAAILDAFDQLVMRQVEAVIDAIGDGIDSEMVSAIRLKLLAKEEA
jgi:type I restriction enzyme M protein